MFIISVKFLPRSYYFIFPSSLYLFLRVPFSLFLFSFLLFLSFPLLFFFRLLLSSVHFTFAFPALCSPSTFSPFPLSPFPSYHPRASKYPPIPSLPGPLFPSLNTLYPLATLSDMLLLWGESKVRWPVLGFSYDNCVGPSVGVAGGCDEWVTTGARPCSLGRG